MMHAIEQQRGPISGLFHLADDARCDVVVVLFLSLFFLFLSLFLSFVILSRAHATSPKVHSSCCLLVLKAKSSKRYQDLPNLGDSDLELRLFKINFLELWIFDKKSPFSFSTSRVMYSVEKCSTSSVFLGAFSEGLLGLLSI